MKENMINYRGYSYIWADDEQDAEKIFRRRFRRSGVGAELEHVEASLYQDTEEREQTWQR